MIAKPTPSARFQQAVAEAARALSEHTGLEVRFGNDGPRMDNGVMVLPAPSVLNPTAMATLRGQADGLALELAHHTNAVHTQHRPQSGVAAETFDALERARVHALGATHLHGVAANLASALNTALSPSGQALTPSDLGLPQQIALLAREVMTGAEAPTVAADALDSVRPYWINTAADQFEALKAHLDDQAAFATAATALIRQLDLDGAGAHDPGTDDEASPEEAAPDDTNEAEDAAAEGPADTDAAGQTSGESTDGVTLSVDGAAEEMGADGPPDAPRNPARVNVQDGGAGPRPYRPFTTEYDEEIRAEDLCEADELVRLRSYLDQQTQKMDAIVAKLANRLQRRLLAQQRRSWTFDLEEGVLDAARLTRIVTDPGAPLSFKQESETPFKDTVVTLLIDNSGSMRGRPIVVAAVCADVVARTLERCGIRTEILGFTTKAWKGGLTREAWLRAGKPPQPGRLNDLRHIVYKSAGMPWRRARRNLGLMMREGLLKENIDGEALAWAHQRLLNRPEERRALMVISDGAPVDDSTLSANTGDILERHLKSVIADIEGSGQVELSAIGIGHDVTRYYRTAITISDVDTLGTALIGQLEGLFAPTSARRRRIA